VTIKQLPAFYPDAQ